MTQKPDQHLLVLTLVSVSSAIALPLAFLTMGDALVQSPWLAYALLLVWPAITLRGHRVLKPVESWATSLRFTALETLATYLLVGAVLLPQTAALEALSGGAVVAPSGPWITAAAVVLGICGGVLLLGIIRLQRSSGARPD